MSKAELADTLGLSTAIIHRGPNKYGHYVFTLFFWGWSAFDGSTGRAVPGGVWRRHGQVFCAPPPVVSVELDAR